MSAYGIPPKLAAGQDRFNETIRFLNGRFDCKVSAKDTNGALCVFDTYRDQPGGPPLHYHQLQDEWFMVLEGDFVFQVGERKYRLGPGDSIFGPRMVPHAFRNVSETGRLLLVFQPALRIEDFFRSGLGPNDADSQRFADLHRLHNIYNVGPSLTSEDAG